MQHVLDCGCVYAGGGDFHSYAAGAERFSFEAVVLEFVGYFGKYSLLCGGKLEDDWHEQALALHFLRGALPQDALKQHALMRYVLVNDP
jgi:hypothetical protein